MVLEINVQLDLTDEGKAVWWAEAPSVPGLSIAADSLIAVQILTREALRAESPEGVVPAELHFSLVGDEPWTSSEFGASISTDGSDATVSENAAPGGRARSELVAV